MTGIIYRLIPGLKEFEDGVEQVIGAYKSIKGIGDYLDKNSNEIVENMGRMVGKALHDIWDDMKGKITISPSILEPIEKYAFDKGNRKGNGNGKGQHGAGSGPQKPAYQAPPQVPPAAKPAPQKPAALASAPSVAPSAKPTGHGLDDLVNDFKKLDQRLIDDQKYLEDCATIASYYNNGYNTKDIIKRATINGIRVRSHDDITDMVGLSIDAGNSYTRGKYDSIIATKLGAKEQLVNDYLAGKSYKEIRDNLKNKTNGMTISDSSILRTMHNYEKQSGKKVVGKKNGKGKVKR